MFTDAAAGVDDQIVDQRFRCIRYQVFGTIQRQRNDFQIITEQLPVRIFLRTGQTGDDTTGSLLVVLFIFQIAKSWSSEESQY